MPAVPEQDPDCQRCLHHYITYEPTWPHGCRAFDFKSKQLPALLVRQNSGQPCGAFESRPSPPPRQSGGAAR
jgi:hypothetical protein